MTYGPIFYVNKTNGTFADTLVAYGLAKLLDGVIEKFTEPQEPRNILIRDAGPYYTVELKKPLPDEWVEKCPFFWPTRTRPIKTSNQTCEGLPNPWDLDAEWERSREYYNSIKSDKVMDTDAEIAISDKKPNPDFDVLTLLSDTMMQALKAYNRTLTRWYQTSEFFSINLKTIFEVTASPQADVDIVAANWAKSVPKVERELIASQLFNPSQGQGQNHTKANRLNTRNNLDSFWLIEFLKMVGIWTCTVPRKVYDKNKKYNEQDRKTYALAPIALSLGWHEKIFKEFSQLLSSLTPVKMDCEAALLYTCTLLKYIETDETDEVGLGFLAPEKLVAGFQIAYYKPLNRRAYTMLSLSFVGLPQWTGKVSSRKKVVDLRAVIKEHLEVVRAIDESHSDGYMLLEHYRDFLSGRQIDAFFNFLVSYSQYLISEWNQKNIRPTQFRAQNLRRLFMGIEPSYSEIIENEGFRAIATAIRNSTVVPQYQKTRSQQGKGEKPLYEIRYGLGQELKRKAAYKNEFITELSDFLQSYNQENAQKAETQQQQWRKNVRISDIEDIVKLVDKFGSEVVCNLLVAFGYARDSKEPET